MEEALSFGKIVAILGLIWLFGTPVIYMLKLLFDGIKDKIDSSKPENQQYYYIKNYSGEKLPTFENDDLFYSEHKQQFDAIMRNGWISREIASVVLRFILYSNCTYKAYSLYKEKTLATIQRSLIEQYGTAGAVSRYAFILGLLERNGILSAEEVEGYNAVLQEKVIKDVCQA